MTVASHWQLTTDPFRPASRPFLPLPPHAEAVARLEQTVEAGEKLGILDAEAGLGKSVVLAEVLRRLRNPSRRIALAAAPLDGASLYASLARALAGRSLLPAGRSQAWAALRDAVRLAARQRLAVVLAVDDAHLLAGAEDRRDLQRLAALADAERAPVTVLCVARPGEEPGAAAGWTLKVRLAALSRSETERYLRAKLECAGRRGPVFTPRAVTRLHALAGGNPRGLDRLAGLALAAAALQGHEVIPPELVEAVAPECLAPVG